MKKALLFTLSIFCVLTSFAQYKAVSGHVYAFKDLNLKNIRVVAKKSKAGVLTDSLGNFVISCEAKDKLIFTGNGFRKVVKSTNKKDFVKIKMIMLEGEKYEEIAVSFGHVARHEINYAVSHYSSYNNDYGNYTTVFDLIQGKFAGVTVVGNGNSRNILVRGVSSTGNNYALYVVNGMIVNDISYIEPINIKSIDVVKDGNAFYGSQGANGVVLITTIDSAEQLRSGH